MLQLRPKQKIPHLGRVLPFCKYASEAWCSEAFSFVFLQVFSSFPLAFLEWVC
jgi:hypothetical protein